MPTSMLSRASSPVYGAAAQQAGCLAERWEGGMRSLVVPSGAEVLAEVTEEHKQPSDGSRPRSKKRVLSSEPFLECALLLLVLLVRGVGRSVSSALSVDGGINRIDRRAHACPRPMMLRSAAATFVTNTEWTSVSRKS
jgi:hypothetical protein